MIEGILNSWERKNIRKKRDAFFIYPSENSFTDASFLIEESLDKTQEYISFFQEILRRNSTISFICSGATQSISLKKDLKTKLSISESTLHRNMKKVDSYLLSIQIENTLFSFPKTKQEEFCRRSLLTLFLVLKTIDFTTETNLAQEIYRIAMSKEVIQNVSLNTLRVSEKNYWKNLPYSYLFSSECSYSFLWKCILGIEPILNNGYTTKVYKSLLSKHKLTPLSSTERQELERIYLFFLCLYPDGIPDTLVLTVCKSYVFLSTHHRYLIDTYGLLFPLFLSLEK